MKAYSSGFRRELGGKVVADDAACTFEFTESGTNDLTAPGSRFPASGRPFRLSVVSIERLRNGKIVVRRAPGLVDANYRRVPGRDELDR